MYIRRKILLKSLIFIFITMVCGELFARYYLGLGTPPLFVTHPTIEYMLKPNQDVYRFQHHYVVNQYGMRSLPFSKKKVVGEFRIMVFGDSVVNGANLTDQKELATEILQKEISEQLKYSNVVVGNISTGSWGPGNWLAYLREYGNFDADIIILVASSHDYVDNPTFVPLNEISHPTKPPKSALSEGIFKLLRRYRLSISTTTESTNDAKSIELAAQIASDDLRSFLELASTNTSDLFVFQNWAKSEVEANAASVGTARIAEVCRTLGIVPVSLRPYFSKSIEGGLNPYRDNIHPNAVGQRILANAIWARLVSSRYISEDE